MILANETADSLAAFHEKVIDYHDLFKVPTAVSLGSLALVIYGSTKIDTLAGMNMIVAGRTGDLLDGFLARFLDQSTDMGAFVDTAADKTGLLAIGSAAWIKDAIPKPVLATMAARHGVSVGLTALTAHNHPGQGFRPNQFGKLAMGADTASLAGYGYANAIAHSPEFLDEDPLDKALLEQGALLLGRTAFHAANALSLPATVQYAHRALSR